MSVPQYDVAIVGAGFAGLYLLHRCRQAGLRARIWEAGGGVGGTWYWNRYPGARCDIESMQYSYQFDDELQQEWNWSERYSPQPEILAYAEHVAERYQLLDGIEFNCRVTQARYNNGGDDSGSHWILTGEQGQTLSAKFCVMATGCLSRPNWPQVEGYKDFAGSIYHTALWPHEKVDFSGQRVAVIGTGSSAIQSIPHIAAQARQLTVFQRTPNYSVPAHNQPMDSDHAAAVKARYADIRANAKQNNNGIYGEFNTSSALDAREDERLAEYERRWQHGGLTFMGSYGDFMLDKRANDTLVEFVHNKINSIVEDPEVAAQLCPTNIIGGKRLCVDTNYYATYNRDNVSLVDLRRQPLKAINTAGLQAGDEQFDVDSIVVATGFDAMTGALNQIDIQGHAGEKLRDRWRDGPVSYLGLAVAGFPNLFTVTGPGSPSVLTNMLPTIEQHVEWISDCIMHAQQHQYTEVAATAEAEQQWWRHVQEAGASGLKQTTDSWYLGANVEGKARVFMPYLGGFPAYVEKCEEVVRNNYEGFVFS